MGQVEILGKLNRELQKEVYDEIQVVYILSRIRKYLELNKDDTTKYKYLKFFCNWALHSRIDEPGAASDVLMEFIGGKDNGFITFDHLARELHIFIEENNLSNKIFEKENFIRFVNTLVDIYSDTPVSVTKKESKTLTIIRSHKKLKDVVFSVAFKIS